MLLLLTLFTFGFINTWDSIPERIDTPEGYELVWSDEFDEGVKPDTNKWTYEIGFIREKEQQWYQSDNATLDSGILTIEGRRENMRNPYFNNSSTDWRKRIRYAEYTSSSIKSKHSFQYGIVEVRARCDEALGLWPMVRTLGIEQKWPANGEIDIMEFRGYDRNPVIMVGAVWGAHWQEVTMDTRMRPLDSLNMEFPGWTEAFHIWKMEWTESYIKLFLDDSLLKTLQVDSMKNSDGFNSFQQPHILMLNLAIGSMGGDPFRTKFPRKFEVDYVRVFQKIEEEKEAGRQKKKKKRKKKKGS